MGSLPWPTRLFPLKRLSQKSLFPSRERSTARRSRTAFCDRFQAPTSGQPGSEASSRSRKRTPPLRR